MNNAVDRAGDLHQQRFLVDFGSYSPVNPGWEQMRKTGKLSLYLVAV